MGENSKGLVTLEELYKENPYCYYCGRETVICGNKNLPNKATRDHVVPKRHGGTDKRKNIVLACVTCNKLKGGMCVERFRRKFLPKRNDTHSPA